MALASGDILGQVLQAALASLWRRKLLQNSETFAPFLMQTIPFGRTKRNCSKSDALTAQRPRRISSTVA
jgi:hypothetical protein